MPHAEGASALGAFTTVFTKLEKFTPVERQIAEEKWLAGELIMMNNPDLKELEVSRHYITGWIYKIIREENGTLKRVSILDKQF